MNFLAHFFLARHEEPWIVGNFLADYLRNPQIAALPEPVREGVALHRAIDGFTDAHPRVRAGAQRLYPRHGKYAPVVLDVFNDYFLARNWTQYAPEPLPVFTQKIYAVLMEHHRIFPAELQSRLPRMVEADWLSTYGQLEGLEFALSRLQRRMSQPERLNGVMDTHRMFFEELDQDFNAFFPDLVRFAESWQTST